MALFQTRLKLEVYRANDTGIDSVSVECGRKEEVVFGKLPAKVRRAIKVILKTFDPDTVNSLVEY